MIELIICISIEKKYIINSIKPDINACWVILDFVKKELIDNYTGIDFQGFNLLKDRKIFDRSICICMDEMQEREAYRYFGSAVSIIPGYKYYGNNIALLDCFKGGRDFLLMGMSHSQCMIDQTGEISNVSRICAPSMDMYLYLQCLMEITKKCSFKKIFLELPYYIFNWDMSMSGELAYYRFSYFFYLNKFHNLVKRKEFYDILSEFEIFSRYFVKDLPKFMDIQEPQKLDILHELYHDFKIISNKDNVWMKNYDNTVKENVNYFEQILDLVMQNSDEKIVNVVIMPFNPIFIKSHRNVISLKKNSFMKILSKYKNINIIDDFNYFGKYSARKYFGDHCHLNLYGAKIYREHINKLWED